MAAPPRHLLKISDFTKEEIHKITECGKLLKAQPKAFEDAFHRETLLMLFEKPSLRTRISFETGMTQMGGHAIYYNIADGPLGKKETIEDTAKVISRMVNVCMARLNKRADCRGLAQHASIPIINALDDFAHPCQMLADTLTIVEKKGKIEGLTMAYCGDLRNNMTYDLMRLAAVMGFTINCAGPLGPGYEPEQEVLDECAELCKKSGGKVNIFSKNAEEACIGVDIIYCDSWMSYGIAAAEAKERTDKFMPFQVTAAVLAKAKPDCIFMNCLPAARGMEQTAEVVDGPQSIIFDQAENRLHAQKALLLFLCNKKMTL